MTTKQQATLSANIQKTAPPTIQGRALNVGDLLPITSISMNGGTQARADLDKETITRYAESMRDGAVFQLIIVYYDGTDHWLADGFHRVQAALLIDLTHIRAEVRSGTKRDAVLYALGANDTHGLARSRDDMQRSILRMLNDAEWGTWGDREIARHVHCSDKTIAAARARLSAEIPQIATESRTVERSGTTYQQKVKSPPTPATPADLPIDFSIVQRRLRAHNTELSSQIQGQHRAYTTKRHGMTGVVTFDWADVLSRLEHLEADDPPGRPDDSRDAPFWRSMSPNHPTAHLWTRVGMNEHRTACGLVASRAPSGSEGGHCSSCTHATRPSTDDPPDRPAAGTDRRIYEDAERADRALIKRAAQTGEQIDPSQIQVAHWQAQQAERAAAIDDARAFSTQQRALMAQWSKSALVNQTTFRQALDRIDALLALLQEIH
jgi:hypothetical protein